VTSFGKEYLCNACLIREPTTAMEISNDADADSNTKCKTQYTGSVSAPVTPAKKDLSSAKAARTATMMTDADSSLDMSTRSLLDTQTTDGMQIMLQDC